MKDNDFPEKKPKGTGFTDNDVKVMAMLMVFFFGLAVLIFLYMIL